MGKPSDATAQWNASQLRVTDHTLPQRSRAKLCERRQFLKSAHNLPPSHYGLEEDREAQEEDIYALSGRLNWDFDLLLTWVLLAFKP